MVPALSTGPRAPLDGTLPRWFNTLVGGAGRETRMLRDARLRTMVDSWMLMLAAGIWGQVGGWYVLVISGRSWPWAWIATDAVLQFLRFGLAARLRHDGTARTAPPYPAMMVVHIVWFLVLSGGIVAMARVGDTRLLVLAPLLAVGFMGYLSSRYAAFPRVAGGLIALLGLAGAVGLLTAPRLWVVAILIPGAAVAFGMVLQQSHQILLAALVAHEEQRQLSMHDPLTGLPNRLLLWERLTALTNSALPGGGQRESFAVLCLDLDGFKPINDRYGHAGGDWLLKSVAGRLASAVREGDLVCRLGGDEFVLVLPGADRQEAVRIAERVIATCQQPHEVGGTAMARVGVSVGIALAPDQGNEADALLSHADTALYATKRRSKGTWTLYAAEFAD